MSDSNTECPECGAPIVIASDVTVGEILTCSDCGADLEVMEITDGKCKLALAPEEEEDWGE